MLSIASKNDPANVHFRNSLLTSEDFVCPQISWGAKVDAISRIKKTLNLQTKHMVFIDDRPDERAHVQDAFPDILTLDACDPRTWSRMEIWSQLVHGSSDVNRTRLYQEQVARDAATVSPDTQGGTEDLKKLGLVVTVERAAKADLRRVASLSTAPINGIYAERKLLRTSEGMAQLRNSRILSPRPRRSSAIWEPFAWL